MITIYLTYKDKYTGNIVHIGNKHQSFVDVNSWIWRFLPNIEGHFQVLFAETGKSNNVHPVAVAKMILEGESVISKLEIE